MELAYEGNGSVLLAKIDCSRGKKALKSGNRAWFQLAEIAWTYGWVLHPEMSVTEPGASYCVSRRGKVVVVGELKKRI